MPSVAAAVIFDLGVGDPMRRPGADEGYAACEDASTEVREGRVGAGAGATVAKLWGPTRAVPGGLGSWAIRDGDLVVGALFVVNAVGEIVDEDESVLAGPRLEPGENGGGTSSNGCERATRRSVWSRPTRTYPSRTRGDWLRRRTMPWTARSGRRTRLYDGDVVFTLATAAG